MLSTFGPDRAVARWFHELAVQRSWLADAAEVGAWVLHPWTFRVLVLLVATAVVLRGAPVRRGITAVAVMVGGGLAGAGIKLLAARPRPDWAQPIAVEDGYSMPSLHAMNAALGVGLLLMLCWPALGGGARRVAVVVGMVVVLSACIDRLVLGVHYLSDVTVGTLLGLAIAAATARLGPGRSTPPPR